MAEKLPGQSFYTASTTVSRFNADREGAEVLGVYAENNVAAAQKTMRENAALVRSQEEESF